MIIKFCGITNLNDALAAVNAGADMLGYNFYPASKRYLTTQACAKIQAGLRNRGLSVTSVGVFVNASYEEITTTMRACDLDLAQLHGNEPPALLASLGDRAFKAIRLQTAREAQLALQRYVYRKLPPMLLLDAYHPGEYGGSGRTGDWTLARKLDAGIPILFAGGLTPDNVAAAIERVHPWGVDVASGIERAPGVKDIDKMRAFVSQARKR